MFKFTKEQAIYDIAGVKVGGNPGENPVVMIGSIFYKGDKTIKDEKTGDFDKERAKDLIARTEDLSNRTGIPAMLDVVCTYTETTEKYLEFAADVTRMPILIDAVSEDVAIKGLDYSKRLGIIQRTVLNSINPETKDLVYQKAKEVELEAAIALTYSTKAIISSKERVRLLETLIPKMQASGIKKILVDTVVMDIATLGLACKAIFEVKDKYGFPAGCGAHNAISSWKSLKEKKDRLLTLVCSSVANSLPFAIGADFVLYGPISEADCMFPAVGLISAAYGQVLIEEGRHLEPSHPRFRIAKF